MNTHVLAYRERLRERESAERKAVDALADLWQEHRLSEYELAMYLAIRRNEQRFVNLLTAAPMVEADALLALEAGFSVRVPS